MQITVVAATAQDSNDARMCPMDVKRCNDGTEVGRIPERNCVFAPCPDEQPSERNTQNRGEEKTARTLEQQDRLQRFQRASDRLAQLRKQTGLKGEKDRVFCPADVRKCNDGTFVSRVGPRCEFRPCPDGTKVDKNHGRPNTFTGN